MSMKIADTGRNLPGIEPIQPTPLAERMRERITGPERDTRQRERKREPQEAGAIAAQLAWTQPMPLPQAVTLPAVAPELPLPPATVAPPATGGEGAPVADAGAIPNAEARPQPKATAAREPALPQQTATRDRNEPLPPAATTAAVTAPVAASTARSGSEAGTGQGRQQASADAVPAPLLAPPSALIASADQSLQAQREAQGLAQQHQQARSEAHVQSMQQAQGARVEAGTRLDVAFRSWGDGHAVVARVDGSRLLLQPSSERMQQTLSGATLPGDVDLQVAVESATDRQPRKHREPQ
ncbi:hypothetical protein WG628_21130 [Stenotrophomonas maltophilia]